MAHVCWPLLGILVNRLVVQLAMLATCTADDWSPPTPRRRWRARHEHGVTVARRLHAAQPVHARTETRTGATAITSDIRRRRDSIKVGQASVGAHAHDALHVPLVGAVAGATRGRAPW